MVSGLKTGIHRVAFQGPGKIFENILKDLPAANVLKSGHEKRVALKPDQVPEPGWSMVAIFLAGNSETWPDPSGPSLKSAVADLNETFKQKLTTMNHLVLAINLGLGILIIIQVLKNKSKK